MPLRSDLMTMLRLALAVPLGMALLAPLGTAQVPRWARTAPLAGYGIWTELTREEAEDLADRAQREGISVLDIDPGVTNTYAAFRDRAPCVQATALMAAAFRYKVKVGGLLVIDP